MTTINRVAIDTGAARLKLDRVAALTTRSVFSAKRVCSTLIALALAVVTGGHAAAQTQVVSVTDGHWSDPGTWNVSRIPGANDAVRIRAADDVVYDFNAAPPIRSLVINGALRFDAETDTLLDVGMIVLTDNPDFDIESTACNDHGGDGSLPRPTLQVGTWERPIAADVTATIRLRHSSGMDAGCAPGIISHGGRMDFHGARLAKTWGKLGATATSGSDRLVLAEPVAWQVGSRVVIPATNRESGGRSPSATITNGGIIPHTEEATVVAIAADNRTLTIDKTLRYDHRGGATNAERRGEVINLSRNVIVESATPDGVRGHTMYHRGSKGSISFAEFRHLGKAGRLGRYPIHFHKVQDSMRGSFVIGASIWDSANRWLAVHNTEFLVVRDTVGFWSRGHGFFLEDGSEVYNLFDNVIGVNALVSAPVQGQILDYDPNDGGCYWAANARNFVYDSTFVECDNDSSFILDYDPAGDMNVDTRMPDGSRQTVAVNRMSGGKIKNLEVHSTDGWGPWLRNGEFPDDEPMLFQNTRVWNSHYSIDISGGYVIFDGVQLIDTPYGFYNLFPGPHLVRNAYCEDMPTHGCFMTYRGGYGTMLYENLTIKQAGMVFRMNAKNEVGAAGRPIDIHARNVNVLELRHNGTDYIGTEGDNVRPDPRLMLVLHDVFGVNRDAVVLPQKQSTTQPGVPPGLVFQDGSAVFVDGVGFEGRGEIQVAEADVAWPADHPLLRPVDRLPPATTIVFPADGARLSLDATGQLRVSGVSLDQFGVSSVSVNGVAAEVAGNGFDWTATLSGIAPGVINLTALAEDAAGNVEQFAHNVIVTVECVGSNCDPGAVMPAPSSLIVH